MEESLRMSYMIQLLHTTKSTIVEDANLNPYTVNVSILTEEESNMIKNELLTILNIK